MTRSRHTSVPLLLAFVLCPHVAAEGPYDEAIARFSAWAEQRIVSDGIPGLSIGFVKDDFTWATGFGFADLENRVPATADSAYRLASVTKPMTAIGILKLVEAGRVDLDAEVQRYVPFYPVKKWPMTVRQVLGHLGGVSHDRNYDAEGHFKHHMSTPEAIAVFADFDLVAEPGTRYSYSSYGYNLLGAVIESAAARPYGLFMHQTLWEPAGMTSTGMDDPYLLIPNRVRGYRRGPDGLLLNSEFVDISSRFAAGGTRSTVRDLLAFGRALNDGTALPTNLMDEMLTPMTTRAGRTTGYGMGIGSRPVNGRFAAMHSGGQAETATYFLWFPDIDLVIAVATNLEGADRQPYVRRLYREVVGEPWTPTVYAGERERQTIYQALHTAWAGGLSHFEHFGTQIASDRATLDAAFETFHEHVDLRTLMADYDNRQQALRDLGHPVGDRVLQTVGSYMAVMLHEHADEATLATLHRDGAVGFFDAYTRLYREGGSTIPRAYRFRGPLRTLLGHWAADWRTTWNEQTWHVDLTEVDDVVATVRDLQQRFLGASVYPDYWPAMEMQIEGLAQTGGVEAALAIAEAGRRFYPRKGNTHFYTGLLQLALGDRDTADTMIRQARKVDPDTASPRAIADWAFRLRAGGFAPLAFGLGDIAVGMYPSDPRIYDTIGELHLLEGDRESAVKLYRKAIDIDPEYEPARRMLAEIAGSGGA